MYQQHKKFKSSCPLRYHGHIKGLILRNSYSSELQLFAFNTSTGPWASLDGRNNLPYLDALNITPQPQSNFYSRDYAFDGEVVAIILHDLSADDAVIIRLNQLSQPASETFLDLCAQSIDDG